MVNFSCMCAARCWIYFLSLAKESSKESHLAGASNHSSVRVIDNPCVMCAATSHHAQYAARAAVLGGLLICQLSLNQIYQYALVIIDKTFRLDLSLWRIFFGRSHDEKDFDD